MRKYLEGLKEEELRSYFKNKNYFDNLVANDLLFANIDIISKKIKSVDMITIIRNIYNYNREYIFKNRYVLFRYYFDRLFYLNYITFLKNNFDISLSDILKYFIDNNITLGTNSMIIIMFDEFKELVLNNIDYFINNSEELIELKKIFVKNNVKKEYIDKLNNRIDNNPSLVTKEIVSHKINYNSLKDEDILPFLDRFIYELKENEKIHYHDIEFINEGGFSAAYKIGDKVLKIGKRRVTFNIRNNKRFLQPLYRNEIKSKKDNSFLFCIEATEFVDTKNISENDVYKIFKELRDNHIIWTDPDPSGLGRLLKDNKVYFNGIDYVSMQGTKYLTDANYTLKKGDIVISDNDMLFDEDDEDYLNYCSDAFYSYEQRYFNEKYSSIIKNR